jgi:poly(3-hydroxybutyrate) depolymerase/formylglycine-generating enzyme required for sulfatase activity
MPRPSRFPCFLVLLLALLAAAIPAAGHANTPYPPGLSDQTLIVNGVQRRFRIHVPAGVNTPVAVVFVLHGGGGEGLDVALTGNHPLSMFRTVADREGFIVVYPGGLPAADATGNPGWVDCRADNLVAGNADDVGFLDALVQRIGGEYGLDSRRLFMTGGSNGAQMTHAFAFHHADRIAAVATGSGSLPLTPKPGPCTTGPSRPLPILILHGDADFPMPWAGGCVANLGGACNRGRVISAEATRDRWLQINGLQGVVPTLSTVEIDPTDGGPAQRFDYAGTIPLQWWRLNGAGHTPPSRTVLVSPSPASGIQNRDIEFAEVVWAFFASRLPAAAPIVSLPLSLVENTGNAADTRTGLGAVGYRYAIGSFEVTAGQYVAFLNAVARTDPYGLYDSNPSDMATWPTGPRIQRTGNPGSYAYSVAAEYADRPVNFVSWGDAARFVNWLHNDQPVGPQGPATTERGAYALDGATTDAALLAVTRSPGARFALPTENEWYKAAYFDPAITAANKYWSFATRSNITPSNQLLIPDPGNNANFFQNGAYSLPGFLRTNVGDFENSPSPWGSFDQMGNVGEWTETVRTAAFAVRGESFSTGDSGGAQLGHRFVRAVAPSEEETKNGFRVVSTMLSPPTNGQIFRSGFEPDTGSL